MSGSVMNLVDNVNSGFNNGNLAKAFDFLDRSIFDGETKSV